MPRRKAEETKVEVRNIRDISGEVTIAGRDLYKGFTAEQVSVLIKQISSTFQPKKFDGRCPYKGLEVFEEEDAELFFGRERLVEDLVGRVKESRTVFITGPSGSGKSSLVRAGLIHALKQGAIKGSDRWLYETMKPGREPIKELSLAFSRLKSPELANYFQSHANDINILNECAESALSGQKTQRFVLFIDQFEEVFTQINGEEERQAFINMLAHAGTLENGRVIVLFAMRSDFVSNCATYPALNELLSQEFRQIGAMQPDELVSAIALPARHVGLPIEDELIARIINDMKGEPGALPLMQFALKDLFDAQQAKGGVIALTLEDYLRHGGIQKSLERHADTTLAALDEKSQNLARSIFSGLIEIGRGAQDTKRTALFDELVPANANTADVLAIVQKLADARLIITDEQAGKDTVTISHEKLIEAWPWLKKLVTENRDVIALQNEIAGDAKEWEDHQRDPSYLYSGARLANAREQLEARKLVLSGLAQEFIDGGIKAHTEELEAARQRANQLWRRSIYLTGALIAALMAVGIAVFFGFQSRQQASAARAGELAAQSVQVREQDFQVSLLLGIEAFRSSDTAQSRAALLGATVAKPQLRQYLIGRRSFVSSMAFSSDGKTLASGGGNNTIVLWSVADGQPIDQLVDEHEGYVESLAFSPDGKILAAGIDDGTLILWDVATRQPIDKILTGPAAPVAVQALAFSPDGRILASNRGILIYLWDVVSGQLIGQPLRGHTDDVVRLTFSPDSKTVLSVSEDKTIIVWDLKTHRAIGEPIPANSDIFAVSPNAKILATATQDEIGLLDVVTRQPIGRPFKGHLDNITSLTFNPDGGTLAARSADNTIILWDVDIAQPIGEPLRMPATVDAILFSPDGRTLAINSRDGTITLWDIITDFSLGKPVIKYADPIFGVTIGPDSKTLVSGGDKEIVVWDVATGEPIGQSFKGHANYSIMSFALSVNGKTLAIGSMDGTIVLWDITSHQPIGQPMQGLFGDLVFSPNGRILAAGGQEGTITLWDTSTSQPVGEPLQVPASLGAIVFSPDGKILAAGSDRGIMLWDVSRHRFLDQLFVGNGGSIGSIAFSPDGETLAAGNEDHTISLWDMKIRKIIGQPLAGHTDFVYSLAFSPDSKTLASGSLDNTIVLWDVATRQPVSQPMTTHTKKVNSVAFSPDGQFLASNSDEDSTIILWDVDSHSWLKRTCQRAGGNFTRTQWESYFPDETYRKTCEQWPLESDVTATTRPTP